MPRQSNLFDILLNKIKNKQIVVDDLKIFEDCYDSAIELENDTQLDFIKSICMSFDVSFINSYSLEDINSTIEAISRFDDNFDLENGYNNIKWVLDSAKNNKQIINKLGIEEKFTKEHQYKMKKIK